MLSEAKVRVQDVNWRRLLSYAHKTFIRQPIFTNRIGLYSFFNFPCPSLVFFQRYIVFSPPSTEFGVYGGKTPHPCFKLRASTQMVRHLQNL
ncbi:hypothetical protein M405DRAFT_501369 [Rhizopogon salebrosus TDB-379]|nr:hypothetical protein M405DRAFT_501369 [Rhizopogon salebrosus TDB-379]